MRGDPAGVLILRVWLEDGSPKPFRARLVAVDEDAQQGRSIGAAATPDDACRLVCKWIEERFADVTVR
jgi:hypothetical protein